MLNSAKMPQSLFSERLAILQLSIRLSLLRKLTEVVNDTFVL